MNFVKKSLSKWISGAIILVIGILCIVAGATNSASGAASDAISVVSGIIALVLGVAELTAAIMPSAMARKSFVIPALSGAILIALGICFIVSKMVAYIITLFIVIAPYLFIVIGALVLVDTIVNIIRIAKAKLVKKNLTPFIIAIVVSVAAIVIGALCVGSNPVISGNVQMIVFGIMLVFVALFVVLITFVKMPDTVVAFIKVKDKE